MSVASGGLDASTGAIPVVRSIDPGDALTRRRRISTLIVLGLLTGLGPFTIDLYLPAFPAIKAEFGVGDALVQLTLSATTIGFALGQLIVGPWSDRVGRRWPLLIATTIHIAASIGVACAPTIEWLLVLRVPQGLGAAAGAVVAMAMVRDLFGGKRLVTALSRLALVQGLAPIVAPVVGSWLVGILDWRGLFWVLAGYGVLVVALQAIVLRETLPQRLRTPAGIGQLAKHYKAVLTDRVFLGVAAIGATAFGGMFAYLSTSSLLIQDVYGFDPSGFGVVFAICSVGVFLGVQSAARLANRYGPQWVLAFSTAGMVLFAVLLLTFDLAGFGIWGFTPAMFGFATAFGLSMPSVQVLALHHHPAEAGTAASLLGALNMSLAGGIAPLIGSFEVTSGVPMAIVMVVLSLLSVAALWGIVRPRSVPSIE